MSSHPGNEGRGRGRAVVAVLLGGWIGSGPVYAQGPVPSILEPIAQPAQAVLDYGLVLVLVCGVIFVLVMGALLVTVIRFRVRAGDDDHEPAQVYGSDQLEIAWTVAPVLVVIVLGLITAGRIVALQKNEAPAGSLAIRVTGHQWWWELEYPEFGFTTANELHLPVDRVAFLELQSQDVIHSFWLPQLAGKTDLIPNRRNTMWIEPHQVGMVVGQCAEYCGTQHANMLLRVFIHEEAEFERWARGQQKEARMLPGTEAGRAIFANTACVNCHTVRGVSEIGRFGPDLTHLMSRTTLAAGAARNDRGQLIDWITNPDHFKPGARMPAMKLDSAQVAQVADYLSSLD